MAHRGRSSALAGLLLALVFTTFGALSRAQPGEPGDPDRGPPPGPPHRPPPVAFEACKAKNADDACEVNVRDRKITGRCTPTPEGDLFCRPDHPPGPPPELFTACDGKNEGDACTIRLHDEDRQGRCGKGRSGRLLCLPLQ